MRTISFAAKAQSLSRVRDGAGPIVAGTRGYLFASFDLSPEWDGMAVAARFFDSKGREFATLLEDGRCEVPPGVTGGARFGVSLKGVSDGVALTTNRVTVRQEVG